MVTTNQESNRPNGSRWGNPLSFLWNQISFTRAKLFKKFFDPRRDYDAECGYKPLSEVTAEDYMDLYQTEPIAARVVELFPKHCFQTTPWIYDDENPRTLTPFSQAVRNLSHQLAGAESFHDDTKGTLLWDELRRADISSRICRYGCLLFGFDDIQSPNQLEQPVTPSPDRKLLYLRSLPETQAKISSYESSQNLRYGYPLFYNMTLDDSGHTYKVHHSRVLHLADNTVTSRLFGMPEMQQVLHRLLDLKKLYGGSAEMFWKGAFAGLAVSSRADAGDADVDLDAAQAAIEQYQNGLQRALLLLNLEAKMLAPQVVDPASHINQQIQAICIKIGIAIRIFMGTERGQLASSQDDASWNDTKKEKQDNYYTPRLVAPFFSRLIWAGVLPKPKNNLFRILWPDLSSQTAQEKASVAVSLTQAMVQFVQGGCESIMPLSYFYSDILNFEDDRIQVILKERDMELVKKVYDSLHAPKGSPTNVKPGVEDPESTRKREVVERTPETRREDPV